MTSLYPNLSASESLLATRSLDLDVIVSLAYVLLAVMQDAVYVVMNSGSYIERKKRLFHNSCWDYGKKSLNTNNIFPLVCISQARTQTHTHAHQQCHEWKLPRTDTLLPASFRQFLAFFTTYNRCSELFPQLVWSQVSQASYYGHSATRTLLRVTRTAGQEQLMVAKRWWERKLFLCYSFVFLFSWVLFSSSCTCQLCFLLYVYSSRAASIIIFSFHFFISLLFYF